MSKGILTPIYEKRIHRLITDNSIFMGKIQFLNLQVEFDPVFYG